MQQPLNEEPFDISRLPDQPRRETPESIVLKSPAVIPGASDIRWHGARLDYQRLLRQYWLWLVCGVISGVLVGHLIYQRLGPEYVATARVLISNRNLAALPTHDSSGGNVDRGVDTTLIKSPLIIEKAIRLHELDKLPSLVQSKDPIEDIADSLKVQLSAGHGTSERNVLDITSRLANRDDAKKIVHALIDAYHEYLQEDDSDNRGELSGLVSRATKQLQNELRQREADYEKFRATAPIHLKMPVRSPNGMRLSATSNVHQENLEALDRERQQILIKKAELQAQIQSVESGLTGGRSRQELAASIQMFVAPNARMPNDPTQNLTAANLANAPALQAQLQNDGRLLQLILEERQLAQQYGDDWPALISVRDQITTLRQYFRSQGMLLPEERAASLQAKSGAVGTQPGSTNGANGAAAAAGSKGAVTQDVNPLDPLAGVDIVDVYLTSLRQQLSSCELREQEVERVYAQEFQKAQQLTRYLDQDRRFTEELDRLDGLWNSIQAQAAKLNLEKENLGYTLKIISPARDEVSLKRVIKLYGAGMVGVLGLLGAIVFFREWQDTTLRSISELRQSLPLPLLGMIPVFTSGQRRTNSNLPPALCCFHRPGSAEAEAYRSVRTAFFVSLLPQQRIVQITSPEPGDGKSTFASNLAIAAAQSGRRVLLIDGDLRRPTQHQLYGLRHDIGVTEVLESEIGFESAVQSTIINGLSVLTSGRQPENPAELLASPRFADLLKQAASDFDLILVDTPPLLAVSDPCIVAPFTDGLLLVLRMGKNRRVAVDRSTELLQTHHVNVLGVVANGIDTAIEGYGPGYDSSYGGYVTDAAPSRSRQRQPVSAPVEV